MPKCAQKSQYYSHLNLFIDRSHRNQGLIVIFDKVSKSFQFLFTFIGKFENYGLRVIANLFFKQSKNGTRILKSN